MNGSSKLPDPFFLAGPTASGKSTLALLLAKHWKGEIINADPFQSYQHIPILTAQPNDKDTHDIPHHLYGFRKLTEECNAASLADEVNTAILEIQNRKNLPIIVTGSGLYLAAILHGIDKSIPPANPQWRENWLSRPLEDLQSALRQCDPNACQRIDMHNPHRVLRALEITQLSGKPFSQLVKHSRPTSSHTPSGVWLDWPRTPLKERIATRTRAMFEQGLVDEIKSLDNQPITSTAAKAIGMETIRSLLHNEISQQDAIALITQRTQQYAKRQTTWFRRESALHPLPIHDPSSTNLPSTLLTQINAHFDKS